MIGNTPHPNQQGWNAHGSTGQRQPVNPNTYQHPGPGLPAEEPRKNPPLGKVIGGIISVAILAGAGYLTWQSFAINHALQPGNCVVTKKEKGSADFHVEEVSCDDRTQFSLKVIKSLPEGEVSCEEDSMATIWRETGNSSNKKRTYYCLQLNLHAGTCYKIVDEETKVTECGTPEVDFKVVKQLPGEDASCESDQQPLKLPGTGVTSCIVTEP